MCNWRLLIAYHVEQVLAGELMTLAGAAEHGIGKIALGLVQAQDFLFDGVLRNEVVDGDVLPLTDAVGTVGSLLLDGGIPPGVEVDDVVGSCQVESQAACLEADEEHGTLAALELLHQLVALLYGHRAVEIEVGLLLFVKCLTHHGEKRRELAEHQHGIAAAHNLAQQVSEDIDL